LGTPITIEIMGANKIKQANAVILEKDYVSFYPKIFFSYK
jgi:hypothetical protein